MYFVIEICQEIRSQVSAWHKNMLTMWGDGYVNWLDCGNHLTIYMYIKTCFAPWIYTIFVNYT